MLRCIPTDLEGTLVLVEVTVRVAEAATVEIILVAAAYITLTVDQGIP